MAAFCMEKRIRKKQKKQAIDRHSQSAQTMHPRMRKTKPPDVAHATNPQGGRQGEGVCKQ
jgi:hypothetical protein